MLNVGLGGTFALCARDRLRADGPFAAPAFYLVLIFAAVVVLPVTLYFHIAHPAWSWLYAVDPVIIPALALVPLVVLHCGSLLAGWYGCARLMRADRGHVAVYLSAGMTLSFVLLALLLHERLGSYGSYADFHSGAASGLMDVKLGYVLVPLGLGVIVAAAYVAVELARDSRRMRSW